MDLSFVGLNRKFYKNTKYESDNKRRKGRDIPVNLSMEQYEKAQRDPAYVEELIRACDEEHNSSDSILPTVELVSQTNTMCEENHVSTPLEGINNEENSESTSLFIWSDSSILLLLALYEEKNFNNIAMKINQINPAYTITGSQCQSKINSLKKTYKFFLAHNNTSGNDRATRPYFDRMNEIFGQTGWAHPVATASETGPSETTPTKENAPKRNIDLVFDDYIKTKKMIMAERLGIRKESLKLKTEQHREKIYLLKSISNFFNNK